MKRPIQPFFTERHRTVIHLREVCGYGFHKIGERLGVSANHASAIYQAAIWRKNTEPTCFHSLSVRTNDALRNCCLYTREDVKAAVRDGRLSLKNKPRNFGKQGMMEVLNWLDLTEP